MKKKMTNSLLFFLPFIDHSDTLDLLGDTQPLLLLDLRVEEEDDGGASLPPLRRRSHSDALVAEILSPMD